jgi:hypothetical protein
MRDDQYIGIIIMLAIIAAGGFAAFPFGSVLLVAVLIGGLIVVVWLVAWLVKEIVNLFLDIANDIHRGGSIVGRWLLVRVLRPLDARFHLSAQRHAVGWCLAACLLATICYVASTH